MTIEEAIKVLQSYAEHSLGDLNDAFEMAISALRQQDVADKDVGKNEPLTLDELRQIYDGEEGAVWVKIGKSCLPAILDTYDGKLVAVCSALGFLREKDYGNGWLAYRQKPEEGTV